MDNNDLNQKNYKIKPNFSSIAIFIGLIFLFAGNGSALNLADNAPIFIVAIMLAICTFISTSGLKIIVFDKYCFCFLLITFLASFFMGILSPYSDAGTTKTMVMYPVLLLSILIINVSEKDVKIIEYGVVLSSCIFSFLLLLYGDYYLSINTGKYTYIQSFGTHVVFEPNYLSLFITLGFEICVVLLVDMISNRSAKLEKAIFTLATVIQMVAMLRTGSRMSLVAAAVFGFSYIAFMKNRKLKRRLLLIIGILIVVLMVAINMRLLPSTIVDRLLHSSYRDGSNMKRLSDWSYGLKAIWENPVGYGPCITSSVISSLFGFGGDAHNTFITFGIYYGLIGFIVFIVLWIYCAIKLLQEKEYGWFAILVSMIVQINILAAQCTIALWIFLLICMMKIKLHVVEKR